MIKLDIFQLGFLVLANILPEYIQMKWIVGYNKIFTII